MTVSKVISNLSTEGYRRVRDQWGIPAMASCKWRAVKEWSGVKIAYHDRPPTTLKWHPQTDATRAHLDDCFSFAPVH